MQLDMAERSFRYIVLTGPPGCGKTSLVKKVCDALKQRNISLNGFITEEIRSGNERTGFEVVTVNGNRAPLATIRSLDSAGPFVGKYAVQINSFESCVLPLLSSHDKNSVLILDEIGKMEMLSHKFKEIVAKFINEKQNVILATVPVKSAKPILVVEMVKSHPETLLLTVTVENRNNLVDKIVNLIVDAKQKISAGVM